MKTKRWYELNTYSRNLRLRRIARSKIVTIIICIIFLTILCIINNNMTNDAVEKCVKSGHDYNYCYSKLVK